MDQYIKFIYVYGIYLIKLFFINQTIIKIDMETYWNKIK